MIATRADSTDTGIALGRLLSAYSWVEYLIGGTDWTINHEHVNQ